MSIRLRYGVIVEDLLAFSRYHYAHSKTIKRIQIRTVCILALCFMVGATLIARGLKSWIPLIFGALASVIAAIIFPIRFRWATERNTIRMYEEGQNRGVLGPQTIELRDDGFFKRNDTGESLTLWKGIERMEVTDRYLFVYISAVSAHVVPRYSITEGDFDIFVTELRNRWEGARRLVSFGEGSRG
jgi:hypothetical protein